MPLFKKKPVVVEARKPIFSYGSRDTMREVAEWCGGKIMGDMEWIEIATLEGKMRADPGDWIIKGVAGEFYPCKPDIFKATYEPYG